MLFKNATIITMDSAGTLNNAAIEVKDGKFAAVGDVTGDGVDLAGLTVIPGIIDAHCHIGMWEDGMGFEGDDGNEATEPVTPELRAIDGINPFDRCFDEAREAGVTTVVTGPGSANVLGGQFCALKTKAGSVEKKLLRAPTAMKAAFGENPKTVYSEQKKAPMTRMAVAALMRQAFVDAQEYRSSLEKAKNDPDKDCERDLAQEAMLPVINGELMLKAHCHRADDILTAIRIAKEFGVKFSLDHCTEGYLIPEDIKESGARVILGPLFCDRSKIELRNMTFKAPKVLYDAGVEFAIMTDHPVNPVQYLPVVAAMACREGLPAHAALAAITINAARAAGIDDRVGSITVGKDADFVAYAGDPMDIRTPVALVVIDGEIVYDNR